MNIKRITILALIPLIFAGCVGTFAQRVKKTEYATASLADGAMKGWAVYYKDATNNPAVFGETAADVLVQHAEVNALARKVGASISTVDTFVSAYATNSASKTAVESAIAALSADAAQLASLIANFTGKTNLLNSIK